MQPENLPPLFHSVEGYFVHCDRCDGHRFVGGLKCDKCEGMGWLFVAEKFHRLATRRIAAVAIIGLVIVALALVIFR